ncbi:MAG: hypothetical protein E6J74_10830 [Deltaproteobacteria bacterium]|jgi:hypothetical protein|nr:MAG: hypothetical protein E6J74_10830 [Deltaproteobacteria bacterium]
MERSDKKYSITPFGFIEHDGYWQKVQSYAYAERKSRGEFRLRTASFTGRGLQSGVEVPTWERIRESIYKGRGG